mgnify:CR=1 FL=1
MLLETFPEMSSSFAVNYDSPYLFYPFNEPIGRSLSGILTLTGARVDEAVRHSLPLESGLTRLTDLDRCYTVSRLPLANGATLCLYNVHLSAYTSDGSISTEQARLLLADMAAEYAQGNYALAGGDFNKDLPGDSGADYAGRSLPHRASARGHHPLRPGKTPAPAATPASPTTPPPP